MAIPFGIVGAVLGHIWLGYDISLVSMMGVIALSGVVINDSLIMIDYCQSSPWRSLSLRSHLASRSAAIPTDLAY